MKKIITFLFPIIFFLMMRTSVCAAGTISTLDVEVTTNSVTVSGTVASVNAAVAVQVLDSGDNIVAMDSFTVLNDNFAGTINGLALTAGGTYTVRVADYDGGTWKTTSTTVEVSTISVTSVALNQTTGTLTTAGQTLQLTATVSPSNASNTAVTWSSSNPSVATVDTTGKVTAVANGTAIITVTTADQNKTATATIKVAISSGSDTGSGSGGDPNSGSGSGSGSTSSGGTTNTAPTTPAEAEVTTPAEAENTTTATTTRRPATTTEENNEETASETKIGVASEDGAEGWTDIKTEINDKLTGALEAEEGEDLVVVVEMNGEDTVPADVFEAIEGQDITVTFDMGNGIVWTVNGMDVTAGGYTDINLGASTGEGVTSIPAELITSLVEDRFCVELTLEYEGEFGFTAVMSVYVDTEKAGNNANLFYYNPETECMEFICSAPIKEDGTADLTFTHASDYVIVVGETVMSAADNVSVEDIKEAAPQETPEEMSMEPVEMDTAENDSFNLFWIIAVGILILVVGGIVILAVNKKKE